MALWLLSSLWGPRLRTISHCSGVGGYPDYHLPKVEAARWRCDLAVGPFFFQLVDRFGQLLHRKGLMVLGLWFRFHSDTTSSDTLLGAH